MTAVDRGIDNAILGAGSIDSALERQSAADPVNASLTARAVNSTYATAYSVVAKRSERLARYTDENESIQKALMAFLIGIVGHCVRHGLDPEQIEVTTATTRDGLMISKIDIVDTAE